jgi:hypothetical protein
MEPFFGKSTFSKFVTLGMFFKKVFLGAFFKNFTKFNLQKLHDLYHTTGASVNNFP